MSELVCSFYSCDTDEGRCDRVMMNRRKRDVTNSTIPGALNSTIPLNETEYDIDEDETEVFINETLAITTSPRQANSTFSNITMNATTVIVSNSTKFNYSTSSNLSINSTTIYKSTGFNSSNTTLLPTNTTRLTPVRVNSTITNSSKLIEVKNITTVKKDGYFSSNTTERITVLAVNNSTTLKAKSDNVSETFNEEIARPGEETRTEKILLGLALAIGLFMCIFALVYTIQFLLKKCRRKSYSNIELFDLKGYYD